MCDKQQHFLTYPQCDVPLEEIMRQLKNLYGSKYGFAVISAEDHEERTTDETKHCGVHRHAYVYCNSRFATRNQRFWDITYEDKVYHPHMEPVKNKKKCMEYVIKDGVYIIDGTFKDAPFTIDCFLESSKTKGGYGFTYMANALKQGTTIDQLSDDIGGHVMNHKRKIEDYAQFLKEKRIRETVKPKFPGFQDVRDPQWQKVVEWINKNFTGPREKRQDQLWLWSSKPKLGKSWPFAVQLKDYFNLYEWIPEEKQDDTIKDAQYLLFDDFHGTCTVSMMKKLSQMYGTPIPCKMARRVDFQQNIPLIVTANDDPRGVYPNVEPNHLGALEDRFTIIEVNTRCWLKLKEEILVPATIPDPVPMDDDKEDISEMDESDDYTKKQWKKRYSKYLL